MDHGSSGLPEVHLTYLRGSVILSVFVLLCSLIELYLLQQCIFLILYNSCLCLSRFWEWSVSALNLSKVTTAEAVNGSVHTLRPINKRRKKLMEVKGDHKRRCWGGPSLTSLAKGTARTHTQNTENTHCD